MCQGPSSRIIVYIYNVLVCKFVLSNYPLNRGGATLLVGMKVATLQYLGRVVWSVKQVINSIKHLYSGNHSLRQ